MLRTTTVCFVLMLSVGCASSSREIFTYLHNPEGVIVPATKAHPFMMRGPQTYYTPNLNQIALLESELPKFFSDFSQSNSPRAARVTSEFKRHLPEFRRQYVGFIRDKHHLIWISATCTDRVEWKTQPMLVADGGSCFWDLTFDVELQTFDNLELGGQA